MFTEIRRIIGNVNIEVTRQGTVIIKGLAANLIERDIRSVWNTSKITSSMFSKLTRSEVRFPSFFALEFIYILKRLKSERRASTPVRSLNALISALEEHTWVGDINKPVTPWLDYKAMSLSIYKPLPHQQEFFANYERTKIQYNLRGMMLAVGAGGGKSQTALMLSLGVQADYTIIVSPLNAVFRVWEKTLTEEVRVNQHPFIYARDKEPNAKKTKYFVYHYEALDKAVEFAKTLRGKVMIVLDESHNLNDIKSLRTQKFLELVDVSNASDVIYMSGTPIKALGFEAIPLIRGIDPLFNDRAELAFKKMYGRDASRSLDILKNRFGLISHIVTKDQFMPSHPEEIPVKVAIPDGDKYTLEFLSKLMADFIVERSKHYAGIRPDAIKYYDSIMDIHRKTLTTSAEKEECRKYDAVIKKFKNAGFDPTNDGDLAVFTNQYEKTRIHPSIPQSERNKFKDIKSIVKYPILKVRGECLGRILMKERMRCHLDMLDHLDLQSLIESSEKKTLIFSSYVEVINKLMTVLETLKYKPLKVHAETNSNLPAIIKRFTEDDSINPLGATFQSLSTAVPITAANGVIMLNAPWRSYEYDQAVARAWRIGQDKQVRVYNCTLDTGDKPNISTRSSDIMEWSKQQVDAIIGVKGTVADVSLECNGLNMQGEIDVCDLLEDVAYDKELDAMNVQSVMDGYYTNLNPAVDETTDEFPILEG